MADQITYPVDIKEHETLYIDGLAVHLTFSKESNPSVLTDIKDILFNPGANLTKTAKICSLDNSMR